MCAACDAGLECENGPGSSCHVNVAPPNPLLALIRGGSRPIVTPVGRMAAGCAVSTPHHAGATAIERVPNPLLRQVSSFDPARYTAINKMGGYSSTYRRKPAGAADDQMTQKSQTQNPNQPPAAQPAHFPVVPVALAFVAGAIFYSVVK